MRLIFLFFIFLMISSLSRGQDFNTKKINLSPNSTVSINGDAGITSFTCDFDTYYFHQPAYILYRTKNSTLDFQDTQLVLENRGFDCGKKGRNKDFHDMVRTQEYPQMKITLNEVVLHGPNEVSANVDIRIAGKENNYMIPVKILHQPEFQVQGQFRINIKDFGLEPITKLFGLIKVDEVIDINIDLILQK